MLHFLRVNEYVIPTLIMRGKLPTLFAVLLSVALSLLAIGKLQLHSPDFFSDSSLIGRTDWLPSVHTTTNASPMVRIDPLVAKFAGFFQQSAQPQLNGNLLPNSIYVVYYSIGCIGLVLLLALLQRSILLAMGLGVTTTSILVQLFHYDHLVASCFCWLSMLIAALYVTLRSPKHTLLKLVICVYFAQRVCLASGYPALVLVPVALLFAFLLANPKHNSGNRLRIVSIVVALPVLFLAITAPLPELPDYSALDHVVPDDGVEGNIYPLVTTAFSVPTLDRVFLRAKLQPLTFSVALAFALISLIALRRRSVHLCHASWIAGLVLAWDIFPREDFVHIGPVATVSRLIPFQLFSPLVIVLIVASFCIIPALFVQCLSGVKYRIALLLVFASLTLVVSHEPVLARDGGNRVRDEYLAKKVINELDLPTKLRFERMLLSPSYPVLNHFGLWVLNDPRVVTEANFRAAKKFLAVANASSSGGDAGVSGLLLTKSGSRWYTGSGPMQGKEWVHLYLPTPIQLRGVKLSANEFHTDFPRGLRVLTQSACTPPAEAFSPDASHYTPQIDEPAWQGSLGFTKSGHAYFSPQGVVKVYFKEPTLTQCVLIQQTGVSDHFDWSIADLALLEAKTQ